MNSESNQPTLNKIEQFLQETIEQLDAITNDRGGRGRPRILPAMCLWGGVVVCVLRGWNSQLKIWRLLRQKGLWNYPQMPISDEAIYKRLEKGGTEPLKQLFEQVPQGPPLRGMADERGNVGVCRRVQGLPPPGEAW